MVEGIRAFVMSSIRASFGILEDVPRCSQVARRFYMELVDEALELKGSVS